MAEEAANPDRDVPRAINIVLVAVIVVYIGISLVALSAMPVEPQRAARGRRAPGRRRAGRGRSRAKIEGTVRALRAHAAAGQRRPTSSGRDRATGARGHPGARRSRRARCTSATASTYTRLYGTQLGSVYNEDPVRGHRALPARRPRLAQGILVLWVGILAATILADRHQRGAHRRLPARLLARPAPPGAADPRPRAPQAPHAVRLHHRLRRRGLPPHRAGQHVTSSPTCTPSAP